MFTVGDTQNIETTIYKRVNGSSVTQKIGTWINIYPKTNANYLFPSITQGFLSDWIHSVTTNSYNQINIYYDEMIYNYGGYHFDQIGLRGDSAIVTGTIQGNIVTHNATTGENVSLPFSKTVITSNISNAQAVKIWESNEIEEYYPNFQGSLYKLTDVVISLTVPNRLDMLSIASAFLGEYEYREYKEYIDDLSNSGSDLKNFNFSWLLESIEAFLSFEILPGFKLYYILTSIVGFGLLMWFIKMFAGG